jgi:hypothetical protein
MHCFYKVISLARPTHNAEVGDLLGPSVGLALRVACDASRCAPGTSVKSTRSHQHLQTYPQSRCRILVGHHNCQRDFVLAEQLRCGHELPQGRQGVQPRHRALLVPKQVRDRPLWNALIAQARRERPTQVVNLEPGKSGLPPCPLPRGVQHALHRGFPPAARPVREDMRGVHAPARLHHGTGRAVQHDRPSLRVLRGLRGQAEVLSAISLPEPFPPQRAHLTVQ